MNFFDESRGVGCCRVLVIQYSFLTVIIVFRPSPQMVFLPGQLDWRVGRRSTANWWVNLTITVGYPPPSPNSPGVYISPEGYHLHLQFALLWNPNFFLRFLDTPEKSNQKWFPFTQANTAILAPICQAFWFLKSMFVSLGGSKNRYSSVYGFIKITLSQALQSLGCTVPFCY